MLGGFLGIAQPRAFDPLPAPKKGPPTGFSRHYHHNLPTWRHRHTCSSQLPRGGGQGWAIPPRFNRRS